MFALVGTKWGFCAVLAHVPAPTPPESTCLRESLVEHGTFTVTLKNTPATGYGWQLKQLPALLKLKSTYFTPAGHCPTGATGCHGNQTFVFEVLAPGAGTLTWTYGPMWGEPSAVAHCIHVTAGPFLKHS